MRNKRHIFLLLSRNGLEQTFITNFAEFLRRMPFEVFALLSFPSPQSLLFEISDFT